MEEFAEAFAAAHTAIPSSTFPSSPNKALTNFWMHHCKINLSALILTLSVRFLVGTSLIRTRGKLPWHLMGKGIYSRAAGNSLAHRLVPPLCQQFLLFPRSESHPCSFYPNNLLDKYSKGRLEWPKRE